MTSPIYDSGILQYTAQGNTGGGGFTDVLRPSGNFTVGSGVIFMMAWHGTDFNNPTVTIAGSTPTANYIAAPGGTDVYGIYWLEEVVNSGRNDIRLSYAGTSNQHEITCGFHEWADAVIGTSIADVSADTDASATTCTATTASTTQANELVYALGFDRNDSGGWDSPALTSGYTEIFAYSAGGAYPSLVAGYKEIAAIGAQSATFSSSGSSSKSTMVQTFKITPVSDTPASYPVESTLYF